MGNDELLAAQETIDAMTRQRAVLDALEVSARPRRCTPLAAVTAVADTWDSVGAEIDIPAGTEFLHVYVDVAAWLVPNNATADPADNGAVYAGETTHVIPCRGSTLLHWRNAAAGVNVTVSASAFGN